VKEDHKLQNISISEPSKHQEKHHTDDAIIQPNPKVTEEFLQKSKENSNILPKEESIPEKNEAP